jgi:pyruvate, orthophosphate dikinase
LVSVRSGAKDSMPGMMDTVLNLGLKWWISWRTYQKTNNPRFAWDSYRRFIQMFGDVVMEVPHHDFEHALQSVKDAKGVKLDTELDTEDLKKVVKLYKEAIQKATGKMFPNDGREQLIMSVNAVFWSWNNDRAIIYRKLNDIKGLLGTAVNVQAMVFGNMGETSGTGVCFTRNPSTGENKFYGEYLMNAQGEDVVAGIRTPLEIAELEKQMPECYKELVDYLSWSRKTLQRYARYGIYYPRRKTLYSSNKKWKKNCCCCSKNGYRNGSRRIDWWKNSNLESKTRTTWCFASQTNRRISKDNSRTYLTKGLPASPGAAVGQIVLLLK